MTNKLKTGDILVFKVNEEWISKAISWLTETDVSHCAMMLNDRRMVEMGPDGIVVSDIKTFGGEGSLLLRLSSKQESAPLGEAAQAYIDSKTRYDFPALAILGGLIIYRKFRPTPKFVAITDLILRAACVALDEMIQRVVLRKPGKALVCSQLVYQIYQDCGHKYRLQIHGGFLQHKGTDSKDGYFCIADLADQGEAMEAIPGNNVSVLSQEELARELCNALKEQELGGGDHYTAADLKGLPSLAKSFLELTRKLLEAAKSDLPINSLFITPGDIAYHSENLDLVGKLDIKRIKAD